MKLQNEGGYVALDGLKEEDEDEEEEEEEGKTITEPEHAAEPPASSRPERAVQQRIRQLSFPNALSLPEPTNGPRSRQTSLASIRSRTNTGGTTGTGRSDQSAETATQGRATRVKHPYHLPNESHPHSRRLSENINPNPDPFEARVLSFDMAKQRKASLPDTNSTRTRTASGEGGRSIFGPKKSLDVINPFRTKRDHEREGSARSNPFSDSKQSQSRTQSPTSMAPQATGSGGEGQGQGQDQDQGSGWRSRAEDSAWKGKEDVFSM